MQTTFVADPDTQLVSTIRDRADDPDVSGLLVLIATGDVPEESGLSLALRDLSIPIFGGIFPGILYEGTQYRSGAVIVSLQKTPSTTVIDDLSDPETDIQTALKDSVAVPSEITAFVFVDGYAERINTLVQRLFESYGVECRFLGGGAGSLSDQKDASLITNDGVLSDAAVLATVQIPSQLGVSHGWRDVGGPFRINEANGTTLSTLDNEAAFSVYRRVVETDAETDLTRENFFEIAKSYPFGISRLHGEKIVRDPFEVSQDGSITCFGDLPEGEYLHVLTGNETSLVSAARDATDIATSGDPSGPLVVFDCISRSLYLEDEFETEIDAIGGPTDPAVGALTIGEIANDAEGLLQFYNKTVVVSQISDT
jgi:hypothetical protein